MTGKMEIHGKILERNYKSSCKDRVEQGLHSLRSEEEQETQWKHSLEVWKKKVVILDDSLHELEIVLCK